jgi:hypothetical protein
MKIGKKNRSTRRKPAPAPLCPPQIPHDQTRFRTPDSRGGKPATNRLSYGAACDPRKCVLNVNRTYIGLREAKVSDSEIWNTLYLQNAIILKHTLHQTTYNVTIQAVAWTLALFPARAEKCTPLRLQRCCVTFSQYRSVSSNSAKGASNYRVSIYEGRLKSNAHMLVERERNDLQKGARWHVEVTFPLNTHKYMVLKLKNCTFMYFLPDLAICFCSRSTSMCALLFRLPT